MSKESSKKKLSKKNIEDTQDIIDDIKQEDVLEDIKSNTKVEEAELIVEVEQSQKVRSKVNRVIKIKKRSKRYLALKQKIDNSKKYSPEEAVKLLKDISSVKFDPTVELSLNLGVDVRQADQIVRGNLSLPKGVDKKIVIAVFDDEQNEKQHLGDSADNANPEDILSQISSRKILFDILITSPKKMPELSKYAKILGPKGLMPTPKNNTVSSDIAGAIKEIRAGRIEFKADSYGIVHLAIGKLSFDTSDLIDNINTAYKAILKAKPSGAKGTYIKNISLSATMLPAISLDI